MSETLDIFLIRKTAAYSDKVLMTQHSLMRLRERKIKYSDIISVITTGEIIEQYPDDFPYPSCLILGKDSKNDPIHIVCGYDGENLWIITAYYPDSSKWESDLKTRKG